MLRDFSAAFSTVDPPCYLHSFYAARFHDLTLAGSFLSCRISFSPFPGGNTSLVSSWIPHKRVFCSSISACWPQATSLNPMWTWVPHFPFLTLGQSPLLQGMSGRGSLFSCPYETRGSCAREAHSASPPPTQGWHGAHLFLRGLSSPGRSTGFPLLCKQQLFKPARLLSMKTSLRRWIQQLQWNWNCSSQLKAQSEDGCL